MFRDRAQAGRLLARKVAALLRRLPPQHEQFVVALPKGGVPIAKEVATYLNAPLTALVSKKIGVPGQPELALGAVSSLGVLVVNEELSPYFEGWYGYLQQQLRELSHKTRLLEDQWLKVAGLGTGHNFHNKRIIVVDDGIATGMTALAALQSVKKLGAAQVILAAPVVSLDAKERLKRECDLLISLVEPQAFGCIAEFYEDFRQTTEAEVIETLHQCDALRRLTRFQVSS